MSLSRNARTDIVIELLPLLANLGDFADDRNIDEGPLCEARSSLVASIAEQSHGEFHDRYQNAIRCVRRIRTAIRIEGHRRLRAALLGA